ncbi:glycosyltransferase family 2 protein [Mycena olivaceomarginata]|nr:glycosyltransferase family 2 protein [Mycena olivaceomarginata]
MRCIRHRGDRRAPVVSQHQQQQGRPQNPQQQQPRHGGFGSAYQPAGDPESADYERVMRKKSLVRPDREKIEPGHRQWHYRSTVANLEEEGPGRAMGVMPSTTGNYPQREALRRGRSLLAREEDVHESGLSLFTRGATLRRKRSSAAAPLNPTPDAPKRKSGGCLGDYVVGPKGPWMLYCYLITFLVPTPLMRTCGLRSPEQQRAWREKIGLVSIILVLMAVVGFVTFGFTQAVCGTPPNRFHGGAIGDANIGKGSVVINGYDYDFGAFHHPAAGTVFDGTTNPLFVGGWGIAGNDVSFMFQKTNQACLGVLTKPNSSQITGKGEQLDWYFPCNVFSHTSCHIGGGENQLASTMKAQGQVYYTWDDVRNSSRSLAVFESSVLDLSLLGWLDPRAAARGQLPLAAHGHDDAAHAPQPHAAGHCLQDLVTVGFIDTNSIGCVASQVLLYLSLIFIVGVVLIRFGMAVMFAWFFSHKLGNFPKESYAERMERSREIEDWTGDIYKAAPGQYRPNVGKGGKVGRAEKRRTFLPSTSRFTPAEGVSGGKSGRPTTAYGPLDGGAAGKRSTVYAGSIAPSSARGGSGTPPTLVGGGDRRSRSLMSWGEGSTPPARGAFADNPCPFPLLNVVPQPPADYEPFNYPLAHTICLVTAYSESLILVICDGYVKGAGNSLTTPEIVLTMMKEFVVPVPDVEAHSYVAIADGHKRHNMAKVYAGFYAYDDATVERSKQQRVPVVLVAKCGNPREAGEAKPGNRGKRDSQIVLMAFLQKVMFDERMTTFEYEFFNSVWRVTGVSPERYELVLCVDADTKRSWGCVGRPRLRIKRKLFEYYISHHMTKAFESMFGGVTCLPGCFSMYRIKAPKGDSGFWVPILANPDIVEHYSEKHRYLTTLMLKTFPKRKNMFCPQAVCKTVVPDTFQVLLSQRRRWINSTIHNLAELILVRDLCGTFCFSMQFVIGMELAGTLVLPAAISFTVYLIIASILPHHANTTISLILLAVVLGLPMVLIVITSRKWVYVGWMLIYLVSLPIWNGLLPAYAFWHFDDFSWGQTRMLEGGEAEGKGGGVEGDKEGEFDSSHIVMKRWAEFERERRWKSGTQSRDSDEYFKGKADSNRYSLASNSDQYHPPSAGVDSSTVESTSAAGGYGAASPRSRHDSNTLLMLPTPLAVSRHTTASAGISSSSSASVGMGRERSSEDGFGFDHGGNTGAVVDTWGDSYGYEPSPPMPPPKPYGRASMESGTPPGSANPFMTPRMSASPVMYDEPEEASPVRGGGGGRGVRLTDSGPVPGPEGGVRRVARPSARRPTSQPNRYSRNSMGFSLPPGAAPPQSGYGQ